MSDYAFTYANDSDAVIGFDEDSIVHAADCKTSLGASAQAMNIAQRLSAYFKQRSGDGDKFVRCFMGYDAFAGDPDDTDDNPLTTISSSDPSWAVANATFFDLYNYIKENYTDDGKKMMVTSSGGAVFSLDTSFYQGTSYIYYVDEQNVHHILGTGSENSVSMVNYITDVTGNITYPVSDLISDQVSNIQINDIFSEALDFAVANPESTDLSNVFSSYAATGKQFVDQVIGGIRSAFSVNGLTGLLSYVSNVLNTVRTVFWDNNDNVLKVTDNLSIMPQEYMGGLLSALNSTAEDLPVLITSLIAPPIGLLVFLVSGIGKLISYPFQYQYETATVAQIAIGGDLTCFPNSIYLENESTNKFASIDFKPIMKQYGRQNINFITHVFNCDFLCASSAQPDNNGKRMVYEGHLDTIDRVDEMLDFMKYKVLSSTPPSGYTEEYVLEYSYWGDNILSDLEDVLASNSGTTFQNGDNGVLSEADDKKLRLIYMTNLMLYMLLNTYNNMSPDINIAWKRPNAFYDWLWNDYELPQLGASNNFDRDNIYQAQIFAGLFCDLARYARSPSDSLIWSWSTIVSTGETLKNKTSVLAHDGAIYEALAEVNVSTNDLFHLDVSKYYVYPCAGRGVYALNMPKYNRATFFNALATIGAIVGVVLVEVTFFKYYAKSILGKWAVKRAVQVEQAWQSVLQNPSDENIAAYRKLALKNNILSTIFGGSKYLRTGFWGANSVREAKAYSLGKAFLSGGAGGVIASKLLGTDTDNTAKVINRMNVLIQGS